MDCKFSNDGSMIVFACNDGTVGIFDIVKNEVTKYFNDHTPGSPIVSVDFNYNNKYIGSATKDGEIIAQKVC